MESVSLRAKAFRHVNNFAVVVVDVAPAFARVATYPTLTHQEEYILRHVK